MIPTYTFSLIVPYFYLAEKVVMLLSPKALSNLLPLFHIHFHWFYLDVFHIWLIRIIFAWFLSFQSSSFHLPRLPLVLSSLMIPHRFFPHAGIGWYDWCSYCSIWTPCIIMECSLHGHTLHETTEAIQNQHCGLHSKWHRIQVQQVTPEQQAESTHIYKCLHYS